MGGTNIDFFDGIHPERGGRRPFNSTRQDIYHARDGAGIADYQCHNYCPQCDPYLEQRLSQPNSQRSFLDFGLPVWDVLLPKCRDNSLLVY